MVVDGYCFLVSLVRGRHFLSVKRCHISLEHMLLDI